MTEEQPRGGTEIENQLQQVLIELRHQRKEVSSLREEFQGNNYTVNSEVKKLKIAKDLVWKFHGNSVQFDFNAELEDITKQASWALEHSKVDYCMELLKNVTEKLRKRNKLIRIADSSPGGWETVRLYEANPIASDSDDEAKIYKAENRALKRKRPATKCKPAPATVSRASDAISPFPVSNRPMLQQPFPARSFRGYQGGPVIPFFGASPINRGACFACGDFRHFRRECPHAIKSENGDQSIAKK